MNFDCTVSKKSVVFEILSLILFIMVICFVSIPTYIKIIYIGILVLISILVFVCFNTISIDDLKGKKKEILISESIVFVTAIFVWLNYFGKLKSTNQLLLCLGAYVFLLVASVCSSLIFICHKESMEKASIMMVSIVGLVYMFVMPISSVPDESVHLFTAYHTSNMILGIDDSSCKDSQQVMMRYDDAQFNLKSSGYTSDDIEDYLVQIDKPIENEQLVQAGWGVMYGNEYLFVPCAFGITVGRLLHLGTFQTFLLGRLFNFLFYLIISFVSLKLLPFAKELFTIILLFPMSAQQGMSYSYDAVVNASAFLMVAFSLNLAYKKEEKKSKWILAICFILSILLFQAKGHAYAPIAVLPYFFLLLNQIPIKEKKLSKILILSIFLILVIIVLIIGGLMVFGNDHLVAYVPKKLSYLDFDCYTIPYFINHPKELAQVIYNSFIGHARLYLSQCIGSSLGWLEIGINTIWIKVTTVCMIVAILFNDSWKIECSKRIIMFCFGLLSACCVIFGMVLNWTPVGACVEWGVQGRYFMPILLPMTVSLGGIKKWKVDLNWILVIQCCITIIFAFELITWFIK